MITELIGLGAAGAALVGGFSWTRSFVRSRLRFVDAVHTKPAPWIAGGVVAVVTVPILGIFHLGLAALALGIGTGLGVRSAQKDRLLGP
jgi:hypothetical protein